MPTVYKRMSMNTGPSVNIKQVPYAPRGMVIVNTKMTSPMIGRIINATAGCGCGK